MEYGYQDWLVYLFITFPPLIIKCILCVCVSELSEPRRCCGIWLSRLACLFIYYFSSPNNKVYFVCVCFRVVGGTVEHGY